MVIFDRGGGTAKIQGRGYNRIESETGAKRVSERTEVTDRTGMRTTARNCWPLVLWAMLNWMIGRLLKRTRNRSNSGSGGGRLMGEAISTGWTAATFFIIPVVPFEDARGRDMPQMSAGHFRESWEQILAAVVGLRLVGWMIGSVGGAFYIGDFALRSTTPVGLPQTVTDDESEPYQDPPCNVVIDGLHPENPSSYDITLSDTIKKNPDAVLNSEITDSVTEQNASGNPEVRVEHNAAGGTGSHASFGSDGRTGASAEPSQESALNAQETLTTSEDSPGEVIDEEAHAVIEILRYLPR